MYKPRSSCSYTISILIAIKFWCQYSVVKSTMIISFDKEHFSRSFCLLVLQDTEKGVEKRHVTFGGKESERNSDSEQW